MDASRAWSRQLETIRRPFMRVTQEVRRQAPEGETYCRADASME
jgi:hypothetical protein